MLDVLVRRLSLVRLHAVVALGVALLASACTGEIIDPDGDPTAAAISTFERNVAPTLSSKCAVCHATATAPQFIKPDPTLREGVLHFESGSLLDFDDPQASRLAVYASSQAHATVGTNYSPAEAAQVTAWAALEALAAGHEPTPTIESASITPAAGANVIDLTPLGLTGTKFKFDYQPLATGMYLSGITVDAGTGGVHLVHPLWVIWDGEQPIPDPIDRFSDIDLTVLEATSSPVGGGTAVFVDVPPGAPLSLHFKAATFANGMPPSDNGGSTGGGCKATAQFTSIVRPQLQANCVSCHGGTDAGATAATDMTKLADDTMQAAACGQILSRISKLNPDQSSIFVAAQPMSGLQHPFKFPGDAQFQAYKTAILPWITAEAAP